MIPRLVLGQHDLLSTFRQRGFLTAAAPLTQPEVFRQLPLPTDAGALGLVLDPITHLREMLYELRPARFQALTFGQNEEPFDGDEAVLSDQELLDLAVDPLELQLRAGATLALTTYHVAGGETSRSRELDLLLAEIAIQHFRDQHLHEAPAPLGFDREIFATIAIRLKDLRSPETALRIAEMYLDLDADGYWVKILGFDERAALTSIRAAGRFFRALREGGAPIVSCGPGQLALGFLVDEISASIGIAGHERFKYPEPWTNDPEAQTGRSRPVYVPRLMRSHMSHNKRLAEIFERAPCRCDAHPASAPPVGARQIESHAAVARAEQAVDALDGDREDRREWLAAHAVRAGEVAEDLQLPRKPIGAPYEALLSGLDDEQGSMPFAVVS